MDLQTKQAKTIMMTGASSLLGRGIIRSLPDNYQLVACYRNHKIPVTARVKAYKLDISNNYQTEKALEKIKPDLLIHAAALSNVDYCESHQNEAWMTNVQSTFKLVRLCEQSDIPIIFISTNAVFDGKKEVYKEDDQVSPLNFYGQTKAEGEKIVRKSQVPWII
ncbi:sugar nucleotide-binding protein, partial [Candidatus Daviesbacteria bacterium]|nr:sugar nucleotide-binding protein [Candidatus Daviesbacteria bacterium]